MAGSGGAGPAGPGGAAFPYPQTLYIHRPNVLHLELRGVRFDVDINILRLFPESVLVGMFAGAGAPGGPQAYPLLALLQSRGDGGGGLGALVGSYARQGRLGTGILAQNSGAAPSNAGNSQGTQGTGQGSPVFAPPPVSKTTAMRWQRFYTADDMDDEASDTSESEAGGRKLARRPTAPPSALRAADGAADASLAPDGETRSRKPSVEKEKHPTAMASDAADAHADADEEERSEPGESGSYDHEEISEDSEDVEEFEQESGIQVLQVNFDPRIFGFILEFFQVMLMSIYSGRASSPTVPADADSDLFPGQSSNSFSTADDRGEKPLPSPTTVTRMLEPLMAVQSSAPRSPATFIPSQPQTIVVVREELDYYVMPEGPMSESFRFPAGSFPRGAGESADGIELPTRVPDTDDILDEYLDSEGNPLEGSEARERIPQRRLFMLALLRRGCGRWLLDRRKILDAADPTPGSPMLHHLGTVSDVEASSEWGYREMEVGKCRMVSLAMLKNVEAGSPRSPQTAQVRPAAGDSASAAPASAAPAAAAAGGGAPPGVITQVDEPGYAPGSTTARRPMRKCWWERRFLRCRIPDGMVDAVERRARRWREEVARQEKVQNAEADLMAAISRSSPAGSPQAEYPVFNPDDEEQMQLMLKYQEAQAELMAHRGQSEGPDGPGPEELQQQEDDAMGLDIDVEEDLAFQTVPRPGGKAAVLENLPGPYNILLNQNVPLRDAKVPDPEGLPWYERSEHIVRLWTRRVYTVEYLTI